MASSSLTSARVLAEALDLPPGERLEIAAELLASVDEPMQRGDEDDVWLAELRRRAERSQRGVSRALPWEDVKQDILARLRDR